MSVSRNFLIFVSFGAARFDSERFGGYDGQVHFWRLHGANEASVAGRAGLAIRASLGSGRHLFYQERRR
jgi:hypothetical protein